MIFKQVKDEHEHSESSSSSESQKNHLKPIIGYYFKRFIHYLTIVQGMMTIIFLIMYFQAVIDQDIINFYLYFSIVVFIIYGFMVLGIHFLEKPLLEKITPKPTQIVEPIIEEKVEIPEDLLQGKTLQVYWYFFTHKQAGVREIQKALNISSSGTVSYQITKLLKAGVISRHDEEGKYSLNEEIKKGVLRFFIRIGTRTFPRIALYLIIYLFGFIIYFLLSLVEGVRFFENPVNLLLLFFLIIGTIIFVFETLKIQKLKPT